MKFKEMYKGLWDRRGIPVQTQTKKQLQKTRQGGRSQCGILLQEAVNRTGFRGKTKFGL